MAVRTCCRRAGLVVLLLHACGLVGLAAAEEGPQVAMIEEQRLSLGGWLGGEHVFRVYFDAERRLRWDNSPIHRVATGECDTQPTRPTRFGHLPRSVLLARPRVDERACPGDRDEVHTVLGLDDDGKVRWQRRLANHAGPATGSQSYTRDIIGADEDGLVANTLEVWSPTTGESLVPAVFARKHSGGWMIPRYSFVYGAWFRPRLRDFIVLTANDPDHELGKPGVHRLDPVSGQHELLIPERGCGTLRLFARLYVEDLRSDPSGRYLAMRRECRGRGYYPWSDFVVFDTQSRQFVYRQRFEAANIISLAGAGDGDFGLAVHEARTSTLRLLRYRLQPR